VPFCSSAAMGAATLPGALGDGPLSQQQSASPAPQPCDDSIQARAAGFSFDRIFVKKR